MKIISVCAKCKKKLFFFSKKISVDNNVLCEACYQKYLEEKRRIKEEKLAKKREERRQKRILNEKKANDMLRLELEQEKKKETKKQKNVTEERKHNQDTEDNKENKEKKQSQENEKKKSKIFPVTYQIIKNNEKILYIYADVKRIKVIEWINSKKRISLNKQREVRRTHAGGFSAEKFQKFIDAKKAKSSEWILEEISKPGILKDEYDKIFIETDDQKISENIKSYIKEKNLVFLEENIVTSE